MRVDDHQKTSRAAEIQQDAVGKQLRLLPSPEAREIIPEHLAMQWQVLPLHIDMTLQRVQMACLNTPSRAGGVSSIADKTRRYLGKQLEVVMVPVPSAELTRGLTRLYHATEAWTDILPDPADVSTATRRCDERSCCLLVDALIREAVFRRASDLHLYPDGCAAVLRLRVDGVMQTLSALPLSWAERAENRIKVLADMDVTNTRLPAEGQFSVLVGGREIGLRVSNFPLASGQAIVIRVLDQKARLHALADLQLPERVTSIIRRQLAQPAGLTLVAGPTGCGKSTTLHCLIAELNTRERNVMTLEDPVETRLHGVRQSSIAPMQGFDFATGLRALLRQDPDVILLGEIRDEESAALVSRATLTGHQVLSTVHASDVFVALSRLQELGMRPAVLSNELSLLLSQRLVRLRCERCKGQVERCEDCAGTGYQHRRMIVESLPLVEATRAAIAKGVSSSELRELALAEGYRSLCEDAQGLLRKGLVDAEELRRVLGEGADAPGNMTAEIDP